MGQAKEAVKVFTNPGQKPGKEEFKKIIMFLVPRLEKDVAPSKFGTMKKAKDKLVELQNKFNKPWIEIVEEELAKVASEENEVNPQPAVTEKLWEELDIDREKTIGEDGIEDLDPITQAEC